MRVGTLVNFADTALAPEYVAAGFEFLEIRAPHRPTPAHNWPDVPLIWQTPPDLPAEHPSNHIRQAVLQAWYAHLATAGALKAPLLVIQFRNHTDPMAITPRPNKQALIDGYIQLLGEFAPAARAQGVQVILRNSYDNREQLQVLREIMRGVPGLGLALDIAYTHLGVVKPLYNEYLWDSDLAPRLAHVYISETDAHHPHLRLPLGALGPAGPDWPRIVAQLRERYDASVTLDAGSAAWEHVQASRERWLGYWADAQT